MTLLKNTILFNIFKIFLIFSFIFYHTVFAQTYQLEDNSTRSEVIVEHLKSEVIENIESVDYALNNQNPDTYLLIYFLTAFIISIAINRKTKKWRILIISMILILLVAYFLTYFLVEKNEAILMIFLSMICGSLLSLVACQIYVFRSLSNSHQSISLKNR